MPYYHLHVNKTFTKNQLYRGAKIQTSFENKVQIHALVHLKNNTKKTVTKIILKQFKIVKILNFRTQLRTSSVKMKI